jgi:hypothetical protein
MVISYGTIVELVVPGVIIINLCVFLSCLLPIQELKSDYTFIINATRRIIIKATRRVIINYNRVYRTD